MNEEKKDVFGGNLPPMPPDNNIVTPSSLDLPPSPQNVPSTFISSASSFGSQPTQFAMPSPSAEYEKRFQEMEEVRLKLSKMLDEIQTKHEKEKQLWEEKMESSQKDSQAVLDEFAVRQLKEEEERIKKEAEIKEEKMRLELALSELETKLEEAREKTFIQALKAKDEEATAVRLEAAMKDVQLKSVKENATREIETIKTKLEASLAEKLLSLQKQYENKLAELYLRSSQKEKELVSKSESLQLEKETILRQADLEKEKISRELNDKIFKRQNEINSLNLKLDDAKENYNKNLQIIQGELTSAKAEILLSDAKVKADYEIKLNQFRSAVTEVESKNTALVIQMESERKISNEKQKSKEEEIAALKKQFLERESLLKTEYEKQVSFNNSDKNRLEAEMKSAMEKLRGEYERKTELLQNEKKIIEHEILIKKAEFEKIIRERDNEWRVKIQELTEKINSENQLLLQERNRFEKLITDAEKETVFAKSLLQDEIRKQREFYEETVLSKEEKIALITSDFEKREVGLRSDFEKRLSDTLNENIKLEMKFRNEIEILSSEYTKRLSVSLDEKTKIEQELRTRIAFIEKEHLKEIDLLKERLGADRELQKQEFQRKIDSEVASKNELEKKYQSAIDKKATEFEKNIRERTDEWNVKIEKIKSDYENRLKQVESENKFLQQEIYKKLEENNIGWQKKLETEKKYLEDKVANYDAELEVRKKQWAEESEKFRTIITRKENDIIVIKTNYENRLTEMSKSESNLKAAIEKLSADLIAEREKFSKELSVKMKEFESKYEELIRAKNAETISAERIYKAELKSVAVENEAKIAELKNELNLARKETETLREKWLEDKKLWIDEMAKKTSVSVDEQRSLILKKAELEALELKLKISEKAIGERIDIEKRKYEEMVDAKNEQLEFLKEQLKNMEDEMDEKIKLITQNSSVDKSAVREKEQEVKKLKDSIEHYKKVVEELEKEIPGMQADNKRKEEKIILMQKEIELKLSGQKQKLDSEFSQKMAGIEKRYEKEWKAVEESLLNANTQNLSEIEKLKKEIEVFKSAQAFQKAVLDAKKRSNEPVAVSSLSDKKIDVVSTTILAKVWKWLNEPV
ncbi:MAG: hypothetical protein WC947_01260 [Elusimicrobiota bacterium]